MATLRDHLAEHLKSLDSPGLELMEALDLFARKLYQYRLNHSGYVPLAIYPQILAIGAVYTCLEVVVRIIENGQVSYLLKYRDPKKEYGWGGLYHIPGTAVRITDWPQDILDRLSAEIFGSPGKLNWEDLEKIGDVLYDESPTRLTLAPTPIFLLTIARERVGELAGDWKEYSKLDDPTIIPFHSRTLQWINERPNRQPVVRF